MKIATSILLLASSCDAALRTPFLDREIFGGIFRLGRNRQSSGSLYALELIDSITNEKIVNLANGTVIEVSAIKGMTTPSFNIRAATNGTDIQSVLFSFGDVRNYRIESTEPFAFCGNKDKDYFKCSDLGYGTYTVSATPFTGTKTTGVAGQALTVTFTIVNSGNGNGSPAMSPSAKVPTNGGSTPTTGGTTPTIGGTTPTTGGTTPTTGSSPVRVLPLTKAPVTQKAPTSAPISSAPSTDSPATASPTSAGTVATATALPTSADVTLPISTIAPVATAPTTASPIEQAPVSKPIAVVPTVKSPVVTTPVTTPKAASPTSVTPSATAPAIARPTAAPKVAAPTVSIPVTKKPVPPPRAIPTAAPKASGVVPSAVSPRAATPMVATPVKAPHAATKAPVIASKAPVIVTKAPRVATKAPVIATKAPVTATKAPVVSTKAPVIATKAPVIATKTPVVATKTPVVATKAPVIATKAPVVATKAPVIATKAPVVATKAPVIATEAPTKAPRVATMAPTLGFKTISKLELIATSSALSFPVMNITLGAVTVINFGSLKLPTSTKFNINAVQGDKSVKSVSFTNVNKQETALPWAYCGNDGPIYKECKDLKLGATINVTIIPYPEKNQLGTPFPTVWAIIQFVEGSAAPTISPKPTPAPVPTAPTAGIIPPQKCSLPKLVGKWEGRPSHMPVAEAQGAMIGTDFVIVGGFLAGFTNVSIETQVYDTTNPKAVWTRVDDYPFEQGITHGAFVVVGKKFYMCGGYAGGGIGMHTDVCMVYDHSKPAGQGKQWSLFAPLPDGGRAGGAMIYDTTLDALVFSGGAIRPTPQKRTAIDYATTWSYSLSNPSEGWVKKAPMPFFANHMSFVTAYDNLGRERHYFSGGQKQEDEHDGNQEEHFEYDAINDKWYARKFMTIPRSHAASSTIPFGCGFIMVAGCTNAGKKITDISYYDTVANTWTKIGDLSSAINTPVCGIKNGFLYCDTGWDTGKFSKKIGITL